MSLWIDTDSHWMGVIYLFLWDPHIKDQVPQVEMVQRQAGRFVLSDYHPWHSVSQMLCNLQWKSLSERHAHNKVVMLYLVIHGLVVIPPDLPYFFSSTNDSTRGHSLQFRQQQNPILSVFFLPQHHNHVPVEHTSCHLQPWNPSGADWVHYLSIKM